ncbi:hypothetical protein jhhlp_001960 [Lomentospora prolificans]|uniref:DUF5672 domain-containing protein n=1 Tax=Lomentospora prolificans TaxID=41688 RepID=A0A2N3NCP4_9PEZI|nr:hypothetical protein jhhlp_001960 [Lomentospora prolificans]
MASEAEAPLLGSNASPSMSTLLPKLAALPFALWNRMSRRMRVLSGIIVFILVTMGLSSRDIAPPVPRISLQYPHSPFNESKVALLIENRPNPILAPLMLHFMSVVPPDWRFRFMGSIESVEHINKSVAIREQVNSGKLDLTYIPSNMSTAGQEMISRFLTNLWLYETVLQPAEWLLIFQTDSIFCANSRLSLNDFLEYDWIGAPWSPNGRWGGNGGLSLRRVSTMIDVLRNQIRAEDSEPEDVWLAERVSHHPGAKVANGTTSMTFSGEQHTGQKIHLDDDEAIRKYGSIMIAAEAGEYVQEIDGWRDGFYEPMGYHTGGSGSHLHAGVWGTPELRRHIWKYCPEVKMTLAMDAAKYVPGECKTNWKRDLTGASTEEMDTAYPYGVEIIDGEEYPMLPPGLTPF